jgi:hypothetical protein
MHRPGKAKHRRAAGIAETQVRVRAAQEINKRQAVARLARLKSQKLGELPARAQTTSHNSPCPPSGHIVHRHTFRPRHFNNNSARQIGVVLYRYVFFLFCGGLVLSIVTDLRSVSNRKDSSDPSPGQMHRPGKAGHRRAAGIINVRKTHEFDFAV